MNFLVQSRKTNPDTPCPQIRHVLSVGLGAISYGIAANRGNFILTHPVLVPEPQGRSQPLVLHKQEEESYRGGGDPCASLCGGGEGSAPTAPPTLLSCRRLLMYHRHAAQATGPNRTYPRFMRPYFPAHLYTHTLISVHTP